MKKSILKVLGVGYFAIACMFLFGANAQAYIDPSVATYAIQAVAGIAIAVGAAVGIYFRLSRRRLTRSWRG